MPEDEIKIHRLVSGIGLIKIVVCELGSCVSLTYCRPMIYFRTGIGKAPLSSFIQPCTNNGEGRRSPTAVQP